MWLHGTLDSAFTLLNGERFVEDIFGEPRSYFYTSEELEESLSWVTLARMYLLVGTFQLLSNAQYNANLYAYIKNETTYEKGKYYSTLYEGGTGLGTSRSAHRNAANKALYNSMASNAEYKKAMDDFFGYDVMKFMEGGRGSLRNPSPNWVWHHPADVPGKVRLIPRYQHQDTFLQDILHPGPNGQGGFGLYK